MMAGSPKEKLDAKEETAETDDRELYLRDGRKVVVTDAGAEQLVEIRGESGMLELRIRLTEDGPVLQMESVRMQLKAAESVEIHSKRVELVGTEQVAVTGKDVDIEAEDDLELEAHKDVVVKSGVANDGKIYLN